jgi:hypothetical protein
MKHLKKFNNTIEQTNYEKHNFITPYIHMNDTTKSIDYYEGYERLEYISSTQTGGQYINLNCNLFQNTDDIIIDIKFNIKGGGKDYNLTSNVNQTKPSVLIGSISEAEPYYGFVVRKADIGSSGIADDSYVTMYTKWQISNSVYKNANGDSTGKQKYYPTYLAGNISGYENTRTGIVYEKRLLIDNLSTISSSTLNRMKNLNTYMFATYYNNTTNSHYWYEKQMWRFSESDVYYCKIMKGNTVIRDLIPVRRKKDNAIGLLDLEHRHFYGSEGDESFVAGPQI